MHTRKAIRPEDTGASTKCQVCNPISFKTSRLPQKMVAGQRIYISESCYAQARLYGIQDTRYRIQDKTNNPRLTGSLSYILHLVSCIVKNTVMRNISK